MRPTGNMFEDSKETIVLMTLCAQIPDSTWGIFWILLLYILCLRLPVCTPDFTGDAVLAPWEPLPIENRGPFDSFVV